MKFETARIHSLGDVFATVAVIVVVGALWSHCRRRRLASRERDARVSSSHGRSFILRHIFLMGWPRALIRYFMTWVENK